LKNPDLAKVAGRLLVPETLTNGEIAEQLDRFYKDPLNMPIPIVNAIYVVSAQARGDDPKGIDKTIRDFRRSASGLPKIDPQSNEAQPPPVGLDGKGKTRL
jgi:hypothetical protein